MAPLERLRLPYLAITLLAMVSASCLAAQGSPGGGLAATFAQIPGPENIAIPPRPFAAYGALLAAAMMGALYLFRGRIFIVYWIGS